MTRPSESTLNGDYDATMRALGELDALERSALILVYWRHRTQSQAAADLDVPVAAVRTAVSRGLQELTRRLLDNR